MPNAPLRPCLHPGCGALVVRGRCDRHAVQERNEYDFRRGSSAARGYDARWRRLRERILSEEPLCRICGRAEAKHVDHIVPKARGGTDDRDNLQPLCHSCHSRKTAEEDGRWGR